MTYLKYILRNLTEKQRCDKLRTVAPRHQKSWTLLSNRDYWKLNGHRQYSSQRNAETLLSSAEHRNRAFNGSVNQMHRDNNFCLWNWRLFMAGRALKEIHHFVSKRNSQEAVKSFLGRYWPQEPFPRRVKRGALMISPDKHFLSSWAEWVPPKMFTRLSENSLCTYLYWPFFNIWSSVCYLFHHICIDTSLRNCN